MAQRLTGYSGRSAALLFYRTITVWDGLLTYGLRLVYDGGRTDSETLFLNTQIKIALAVSSDTPFGQVSTSPSTQLRTGLDSEDNACYNAS
jgi:hypothetical protein